MLICDMNLKNKRFEFLDHTADLEFVSCGETLELCFENAALALFSAILDLNSVLVQTKKDRKIEVKAQDLQMLLHDWLSELLFLFSTDGLVFKDFKIKIEKNKRYDGYELIGVAYGEHLDLKKHRIETEVKAITYHDMLIEKREDKWFARVICDI